MIDFAQNPYRVLGVFANDSLKVRTANIARIRAFSKVGKECHFESDFVDIFGPIDRSEAEIEKAISILSSDADAEFYSCLWVHRSENLDANCVAPIDIVHSGIDGEDKASLVNVVVGGMEVGNYDLVAQSMFRLFEVGYVEDDEIKKRLLVALVDEDSDEENTNKWWMRFKHSSIGEQLHLFHPPVSPLIRQVYNELAIDYLEKLVQDVGFLYIDDWKSIRRKHQHTKPYLKTIIETSGSGGSTPNAAGQLAFSSYAEVMVDQVKFYYEDTRFWDAKPVEDIILFLKEINKISYSSTVKEECESLEKELTQEIPYLAPKQVKRQSQAIRGEVELFCERPDETRWSLHLLNKCVPHLIKIKSVLGSDNPYYKRISTQIADNALYVCQNDLASAKRKYGSLYNDPQAAKENLRKTLQLALQLCENLKQLNLEAQFANGKLENFSQDIDAYLSNHEDIVIERPVATISLQTEEEMYAACSDYASLMKYIRAYPNAAHFGEAMQRIWQIEDKAYPRRGSSGSAYIKALLAYKKNFPNSHNDKKLLAELNAMLLGSTMGTVYDYRAMLQLWPNHPKAYAIKTRLDHTSFKQCNSIADWEEYLKEFPNGLHRVEAIIEIEKAKEALLKQELDKCKTIEEYQRFIVAHPESKLCELAEYMIERMVYEAALASGQYNNYLSRYPNGHFVTRLKEREEQRLYKSSLAANTLKQFVKEHPDSKYAILAREVIKRESRWSPAQWMVFILWLVFLITGIAVFFLNFHRPSSTPVTSTAIEAVSGKPSQSALVDMNPKTAVTTAEPESTEDADEKYKNNSLKTGSKPYASSFGKARTGGNSFYFRTTEGKDYVIIVRRSRDNRYVNHTYIKGGESSRIYVPDGIYNVYFYSGKGWNPHKEMGGRKGGFVDDESLQKDGSVDVFSTAVEYTLYPVYMGNLRLANASEKEAFN